MWDAKLLTKASLPQVSLTFHCAVIVLPLTASLWRPPGPRL